ncbi:MAG TPA: 3-isopropylmalate dehydrogenase [Gemmatimonadaceae bacterium]|nr:3-isopropylmalate dehydrogenase [Gemmatimonadaceae bacterium]
MRAQIVRLPGDGIGPEVVAEGVRVLDAVAERWGHTFVTTAALIGGAAIDATGTPLPDETVALCRASDAVLLGAVGGPAWDNPRAKVRPEQGLLGIRQALGLFANVRPVAVHEKLAASSPLKAERLAGVDLVVVRELTGGIYFGEKSRTSLGGDGERAMDVCTYSTMEIERVVRVAGKLALARRGKLTSVDKANVLETSRLWREVTMRVVAEEFPSLEIEHLLVDACAMHLLQRPASFDVIVTENMFGDILTDEASVLAGSIGLLPSASLGASVERDGRQRTLGIYEPIHGSAPDIAGRGLANPIGMIASIAMLLRHSLGLDEEALAVEEAVHEALGAGALTADLVPKGTLAKRTSEVTDAVIARLLHTRTAVPA